MYSVVVIIGIVCVLLGIAISVAVFGTGGRRAKIFEDIYFAVDDEEGKGILYTKRGDYSVVISLENPVQKYSADVSMYYDFASLINSIVVTLGEGFAIHKQDIFVRRAFDASAFISKDGGDDNYLSDSYFKHFNGREQVVGTTYLVITRENKKSGLTAYDKGKWRDFLVKVNKVMDLLHDGGCSDARFLKVDELRDYVDRFFAQNFRDAHPSLTNFSVDSDGIQMGDRQSKVYSLLDLDRVDVPDHLRPYQDMTVNNSVMPVDLMSDVDHIPLADTVVYNQVIFIPGQRKEIAALEKNRNMRSSIPSAGNKLAAEDIAKVQDVVARENKLLVYAHFNIIASMSAESDMQKVTNHLENMFSRLGIHISRRAYNQLELFIASFPGNCFAFNEDYDRFLTLGDAATCLMYKERQTKGDITPVKSYYTDRQGFPLALDLTGKEGKIKYTDNSNFFVLGPSGSGKSFFMNTVMRQYFEQNTDCVIVDTGDSYEGICSIFGGTYISYSKENPISMNPFKVSVKEYSENFGEKKNFLKSLIFLIFKGNQMPSKIEDTIINQTIIEYFREFFTPFDGYSDGEREELRQRLLLSAKKDGTYQQFEKEVEKDLVDETHVSEKEREQYEKLVDREEKLQRVIDDAGATDGEKAAAKAKKESTHREIMRMQDLVSTKFNSSLERRISKMEEKRRKLRVRELSFNTYYEYAVQRIPDIMEEDKVSFAIDEFAAILKPFYKGGELEYTLNNDMDSSLFDERFIVFEIDKVKDDPVLFPIIVLIIMDVFTQKMRIKGDCRKCLVIEEAWKAIATPVMAEYIKYLYKTARKHWAMVGVVTQELQDITSSDIVKDAIINNSSVFMLLDQSKFKDKFDDIKSTLALTDIDCKKIFTINRLDNKEGRSPFKEVFIKRGLEGDVFGVEEPRECYMSYTTEKAEKEALKLYKRELRCTQLQALRVFIRDWKKSGIVKSLDFAQYVNSKGHVLSENVTNEK